MDRVWSAVFTIAEDLIEIVIIAAFLATIMYWAAWTMETAQ